METEKLIAALRYCDAVVNEAADALERLTAQNAEKDAEIEQLKEQIKADSQLKSGLDNANALCRTYKADRDRLQAELDAAVDDLKIASDCATCDMRGEKGFSACAPLFAGDEQSCKNYKWRGKEHD